jgi:hypothetical protein
MHSKLYLLCGNRGPFLAAAAMVVMAVVVGCWWLIWGQTILIPWYVQWFRPPIIYTCCTWAGGTFFPVVLLCQFFALVRNMVWFYILMYLEYNTVVVLC